MLQRRFRNYWRMTLILSLGCVVTPLFANPVVDSPPLTLKRAVEKTLQHNPQLYQFEFLRQRMLSQREASALAPGYNLSMDVENIAGTGKVIGFDSAEITVALSSVIELGGKLESRLSVADARKSKFELESQVQTLDVLGDLTHTFIQLLSAQEEVKLAGETVVLSDALFKTVQQRAQRGAASDAEVMRARAMLTQSKIQKDNQQRKLERHKVSLVRYWGETRVDFSALQGDLFAFGESQNFADLYEKVQQSPAVSVFASELRLKEAEVRLAQTQNRADLSWQFGVRRFEDSSDTGLTLGLSMPLFAGDRNRSSVDAALAERNAVEYQRTDRLLLLHDRLFSAYSQRQQFMEAHQRLKRQVIPDLEKSLSITHEAYDQGRLKYQDWIAAQQELLNAKQQLIETATAALLNQAAIEQLTAKPLTY